MPLGAPGLHDAVSPQMLAGIHPRLLPLIALAALAALAGCDGTEPDEATEVPTVVDAPQQADDPTPTRQSTPDPTPGPAPDPPPDPTPDEPDEPEGPVEVVVDVAATDLEIPWELVWAGEQAYVTERDTGTLRSVDLDTGDTRVVDSFDVDPAGEGGLLGLAVHPDDDATLYAYYSSAVHGDNRVVRFTPGEADDAEVIVDGIPHAAIHNGGRLAFGPDDHLYITTGDANGPARAQDQDSLAGAILRVTPDGEIPPDNPFDSRVYATGIRNTQGLAWTADGDLIAAEFGPDEDDEVNVIQRGANYGWPEVSGQAGVEPFIDPIFVRQPPVASWSGNEVLTGGAIPQWEGDAFLASLRGERLWHLALSTAGDSGPVGPDVVDAKARLEGDLGRLRQVTQGPDGSLWLLTSNRDGRGTPAEADDRILRLGPAR